MDGETKGKSRAVVPFRHRHDGWTAERQAAFLTRLEETGCVAEACRAAGLTTTSGYRAYARMPDFAAAWNRALAARRPMLEDAAFERAVRGVAVPLTRLGRVVGKRIRYSDALLRFLIERADRLAREAAAVEVAHEGARATREETDAALTRAIRELVAKKRESARRELEKAGKPVPEWMKSDTGGSPDWWKKPEFDVPGRHGGERGYVEWEGTEHHPNGPKDEWSGNLAPRWA